MPDGKTPKASVYGGPTKRLKAKNPAIAPSRSSSSGEAGLHGELKSQVAGTANLCGLGVLCER
jgi:hypothetical protein